MRSLLGPRGEFEPTERGRRGLGRRRHRGDALPLPRKSGYRLIHDWAKAGLLEKIGVVKSCVERKRKRVEGLYHPAMMPDHAIRRRRRRASPGRRRAPMIHAVTLEETAAEFAIITFRWRSSAFRPTRRRPRSRAYLNHHPMKTLSELVEMGYDRERSRPCAGRHVGFRDYTSLARPATTGAHCLGRRPQGDAAQGPLP
jgi:hypothetical protein